MIELLGFARYMIGLYTYVVIAGVVMSWLLAFGVVNPNNNFVRQLYIAINAVTEPLLRPIRNALPNLGAVDISPVVLLVGCVGISDFFIPFLMRTVA